MASKTISLLPYSNNLYWWTAPKIRLQIPHSISSILILSLLFVVSQGHQVEVQSQGGNVTCVGTIHGNVNISTCGDSVRTVLHLHSAFIRGQQQPKNRLYLNVFSALFAEYLLNLETKLKRVLPCITWLRSCAVISCVFAGSGCQEAPGHQNECFNRMWPSEDQSHLCGVQLHLLLLWESRTGACTWWADSSIYSSSILKHHPIFIYIV